MTSRSDDIQIVSALDHEQASVECYRRVRAPAQSLLIRVEHPQVLGNRVSLIGPCATINFAATYGGTFVSKLCEVRDVLADVGDYLMVSNAFVWAGSVTSYWRAESRLVSHTSCQREHLGDTLSTMMLTTGLAQTLLAESLGLQVGEQRISVSMLCVPEGVEKLVNVVPAVAFTDPVSGLLSGTTLEKFLQDTQMLTSSTRKVVGLRSPWVRRVLVPLVQAHRHYQESRSPDKLAEAKALIMQCSEPHLRHEALWRHEHDYGEVKGQDKLVV